MRSLAILLIRLIGLWLITAIALSNLPYYWDTLIADYEVPFAYRLTAASHFTLPGLMGLFLIMASPFIAGLALRGTDVDASRPDEGSMRRTGVLLLGLYLVATAIPTIAPPLFDAFSNVAGNHSSSFSLTLDDGYQRAFEFWTAVGEVVIGTGLAIFARRF